MADVILRIRNLSKTFRSDWLYTPIRAVENLSLDVFRGEIFGFLGANGAGKTTTMKCVLGLIRMTAGDIEFDGEPLRSPEQRRHIGYLPELPYFYDHLTVFETLDLFASLYGIRSRRRERVLDTLCRVGLVDRHNQRVSTLSKGLQQRLGFAQAIINEPKLLMLDEPFSGLDPFGRRHFRTLILELHRNGATVFLSSHILSDVEHMSDRISIMSHGQLCNVLSLKDAPAMFGDAFELTLDVLADDSPLRTRLLEHSGGKLSRNIAERDTTTFSFATYEKAQQALRDALEMQAKIRRFAAVRPSLEDIFVAVADPESSKDI